MSDLTGFCRHPDCNAPGIYRMYKCHGDLLHSLPHCEDHTKWAEGVLEDYIKQLKGVKDAKGNIHRGV